MPNTFTVSIDSVRLTLSMPGDQLRQLEELGNTLVVTLGNGCRLTLGPFEWPGRVAAVASQIVSAVEQAQDTRETPTTREEYFATMRQGPWTFPYVGSAMALPPPEWIADAWDLEEVQSTIVEGGLVRNFRKGLGLCCSGEFLGLLASSLRTEQVVALYRAIRDASPHRESEFREDFLRAFSRHASSLPAPLSREEVIRSLGIGEPEPDPGGDVLGDDEIPF